VFLTVLDGNRPMFYGITCSRCALVVSTDKTSTDRRALRVDGTAVVDQELATILDQQVEMAGEGKFEADRSESLQTLILISAQFDTGEAAAAGGGAIAAAGVVIEGGLEQ